MFHEHGNLRKRTQEFARRVLRAGSSVGANYREAQRGRSVAEYRSKIGDCLREADEALYWMELLELDGYFNSTVIASLKQEAGELIAIFVSLLRSRPTYS
jgi:four helix bundle protein